MSAPFQPISARNLGPQLLGALSIVLLCGVRPARAEWPSSSFFNVAICAAPGAQAQPAMTTDGVGGAIFAWSDQRGGATADIYAARVGADGALDPAWPVDGRALCLAAGTQSAPKVASDGAGGAFVVWQDGRSGINTDVYATRILADGQVDPQWPINGLLICGADSSQLLPEIRADGTGGAYVLWSDLRSRVDRDVYLHHVLSTGDLDPAWPVDGLTVCAASGNQFNPDLANEFPGSVIVAWGDVRSGVSDLYASRILSTGVLAPGWVPNGNVVCAVTGSQQLPSIAPDGSGGAFVCWVDLRSGGSDIYASRIHEDGSIDPAWTGNGLPVCTAAGDQSAVRILATAPGEAILTWMDARSGALDIYGSRLLASGPDASWTAGGVNLCAFSGDQRNPVLAADGAGGAIVGWQDNRFGALSADIYAQHVLAGGVVDPAWPVNGSPIGAASGVQQSQQILADGAGGAILGFSDARSTGVTDIYAQRVKPDGLLGGTVVGVESGGSRSLALDRISPNPARGSHVRIDFSLAKSGPVTLEILDLAGRLNSARALGVLCPGRHAAMLRPSDARPGTVWLIRIRQGEQSRLGRLVWIGSGR